MTILTAAIPLVVLIQITWAQDIATCGLLPQYNVPLMINSNNTHHWPWHAAIYHRRTTSNYNYQCGGTLIATNWILTAGHCVLKKTRQIKVSLGRLDLAANESRTEQSFTVDEIILHESFNLIDLHHDIALVRLSGKAVFTRFVRPICLWKSYTTDVSTILGKYGTVVGWGRTETNDVSATLREASFKVVSHIECLQSNREFYGDYLTNTSFCAGLRNGTSPCHGDSGGSMTFAENGVYYIRGIVSEIPSKINHTTQQQDCDTKEYALYTDVAKYLDWIREKMDTETLRAENLVWSDEFNGPAGQFPNASKWDHNIGGDGWGNEQRQYYTDSSSNAALDGKGNLIITARRENPNNYKCWYGPCDYTSARLTTFGKFEKLYGTIEARIRLPTGTGFWPAFWMLGDSFESVGLPGCGAIDIMENVGSDPLTVSGGLQGAGYFGLDRLNRLFSLPNGQPFADDFHIYQIVWTPDFITFSVDGLNYATMKPSDTRGSIWAFNHPFFIILNLAVGGTWPGEPDGTSIFPQTMVVDYVRVYEASDTPTPNSNRIRSYAGEFCLDVANANRNSGTRVQVAYCNGNTAQDWTINNNDHTIRGFGKCLDVAEGSLVNGARALINDCNGNGSQQWIVSSDHDIVNIAADRCLDIRMPAGDGARAQLWECTGASNQKWNLG